MSTATRRPKGSTSATSPASPAMIRVLGAIAYGEWKAYEEAMANAAAAASDAERLTWERVAGQELGHHRGFLHRLEALGGDPDRAMRPYRKLLDRYHGQEPRGAVEGAVWSVLGEGIAEDLLHWLASVSDEGTAAWIANVLNDEAEHEQGAEQRVAALVSSSPLNRVRAMGALVTMLGRLARSTEPGPLPLRAFVGVGRSHELLGAVVGGYARRARRVGRAAVFGRTRQAA